MKFNNVLGAGVVSQARPFPFCSMRHVEEGSGDLGPLCVNVRNVIIESVMCKDAIIRRSRRVPHTKSDRCCGLERVWLARMVGGGYFEHF